tara:strand:+ start:1122 stop:1367 length:246 start_codon:yes stop_codon:yes gene_type:complete
MANKVDIYHYDTATDVRQLTLSNCSSTTANDYMVLIQTDSAEGGGTFDFYHKPLSISGSTMTLADKDIEKCKMICVIEQGN